MSTATATASDLGLAPAPSRPTLVIPLLLEAVTVPLRGPFRLGSDLFGALQGMKMPEWLGLGSLIGWIIPLAAFAVFLGLFASANPLIEYRLMQIDPYVLFDHFELSRTLFWVVAELRSGREACQNRLRRSENWRAWGFRTWRLRRYLANNSTTPPAPSDSGKG